MTVAPVVTKDYVLSWGLISHLWPCWCPGAMLNLMSYKSKWHVLLSGTMVMPRPGKHQGTISESKALLQPESVLISVPPVAMRAMWRPEVRATTWGHVCAQGLHYHWDDPDLAGIHHQLRPWGCSELCCSEEYVWANGTTAPWVCVEALSQHGHRGPHGGPRPRTQPVTFLESGGHFAARTIKIWVACVTIHGHCMVWSHVATECLGSGQPPESLLVVARDMQIQVAF